MSKRSAILLIQDILEAVGKIRRYTEGLTVETFLTDERTVDAVVRNLEIIGEAANRLPGNFKDQHRYVEWFRIAGLRNRIVHDYFGLDIQIIWQIIQYDLPVFNDALTRLSENTSPPASPDQSAFVPTPNPPNLLPN